MRTLILTLSLLVTLVTGVHADTRLRDGDAFKITIGGPPRTMTQEFEIEYVVDDGTVQIPMIPGRIRAAGLTSAQLAQIIEKRLRDEKIFTNPSVLITPLRSERTIIVGGAVRAPGERRWIAEMTLTQAIASASGFGDLADDKIKLIRGGKAVEFSRKAIRKDPASDPKILPNDYIEVQGDL
jgi:protein involved in polysaccharide export with SLBB domain